MADQQLFLFGQTLPGSDSALLERIQECASYRNNHGALPTKALEDIPAGNILQIAVGHNHIAFLFKDHRIARLSFEITQSKVDTSLSVEKSCSAVSNSSLASASTAVAPEIAVNDGNAASSSVTISSQSTSTGSQQSSSNATASSYAAAAAATAAANRTAKIRRVMMAARRPGGFCGRTGVIVDRARPLVPASSIPEELIAQAQVVV
jgi:hypothetical protein